MMSVAEESPILIPSEDEDEDGDDVQYIKEEKAPPITIDENEDQDDVIFISTLRPPPLPPSWNETLGISENIDLDAFSLVTSNSSCSSHLPDSTGNSSPGTPLSQVTAMTESRLSPAAGSNALSNALSALTDIGTYLSSVNDSKIPVDNGCKVSVGSLRTDLSLEGGSDITSASNLTPISAVGLDSDLPGMQLQNALTPVTAASGVSSDSLSLPVNLHLPSSCGSSENQSAVSNICSSSAGKTDCHTVMASNSGLSQSAYPFQRRTALLPTSGPLDLSPQEKCQVLKPGKEKRAESISTSSDADSNSTDSSCVDDQGDGSSEVEMANRETKGNPLRATVKASLSAPLCPASLNVASYLTCPQTLSSILSGPKPFLSYMCNPQVVKSPGFTSDSQGAQKLDASVSAGTLPTSLNHFSSALGGIGLPKQSNSTKNIPSTTAGSSFLSDMTDWLDCGSSSVTNNSYAQSSSAVLQSAAADMVLCNITTIRNSNHFHSSVILPSQSVGATSTTTAQVSFSSNITQTSSIEQIKLSNYANMLNSNSHAKQCISSPSISPVLKPHRSQSVVPSSSAVPPAEQRQLQVNQQTQDLFAHAPKQQQKQVSPKNKGTGGTSDSVLDKLLRHHQQPGGSKEANSAPALDFLDKLLGDCDSILSSNTVQSGSTSSLTITSAASNSSTSTVDSSLIFKSSLSAQAGPTTTVSDKTVKRPIQYGSLSILDNSSLPPRKRVRSALLHSSSITPSATSAFTPPSSLPNHVPSINLDPSHTFKPVILMRNASYLAADQSHQTVDLSKNLKKLSDCNSPAIKPANGNCSSAVANKSKVTLEDAGCLNMVMDVQSQQGCKKCHTKEGEKSSDGDECKLSLCPSGHAACGNCLMVQARRVLSGKQKESLKCIVLSCGSFYHINELKNSLPALIVDILQERLDHDLVEYIDNMITDKSSVKNSDCHDLKKKLSSDALKNKAKIGHWKHHHYRQRSSCDADDEDDDNYVFNGNDAEEDIAALLYEDMSESDEVPDQNGSSNSCSDQQSDFPEHWTKMDNSKNLVEVVAVPLEPDSDEYINVAVRFHEHMRFPAADITRIIRIQNPYLWKSYSLKKEQMIQENGGMVVSEYQLFHGTKGSTIDAICRRGFDWRFCGKHGTAYGHGCYFAGDSFYSNTYTDRGSAPSTGSVFLKSIMQVNTSLTTDPSVSSSPSLLAPPPPKPQPSLRSCLLQQQNAAPLMAGSSSNHAVSRSNLNMKKILPLLKSGSSTLVAELLRQRAYRAAKRQVSVNVRLGTSGHSSCPSQPLPSGAHGGQVQPSVHHAQVPVSRPQHAHSQSSVQPQTQTVNQYQRYSLLTGSKRPHAHASPPGLSSQPGHCSSSGNHGPQPGQFHPSSNSAQGLGHKAHQGFAVVGKPNYVGQVVKNYNTRTPCYSSGSPTSGKVSLVRSSSAQLLTAQTGGGLIVPVGNYPASLSVATTAVTLSGAGAQPLALLTASPASSTQGNSYLLVAPLATPAAAPPLPPAPSTTLPPPPPQLLGQPGSLPTTLQPKPLPWSCVGLGSAASSQALDLRKQGTSSPRYMFLAKVLTGKATGGQADFRRPPPLDPLDPLGRCYDSCVDNIYTPRIWVIFDSTQAYPEYAIEYHVNGDLYR